MKKFLFVFLFLATCVMAWGQEDVVIPIDTTANEGLVAPPVEDSSYEEEEYEEPLPLSFSEDSIRALREQKEYSYMKNLDSALRNLKMEPQEKPSPPSKSVFDLSFVRAILWGLAIFAVLYLLFQLFAGQQGLFAKNKQLETGTEREEISERTVSPLSLLQQAAARGDYRHAVRYHYLYLLQLMAERNHIVVLPQKTNNHYLNEIRQKPFYNDFSRLTIQYEYIWYGEFSLSREQYEMVESGFRKFTGTWL
ncbi:MAG: hypothetical protein MUE99_04460 [Chitinophagaceae bacterium]|jgi:hypothetical protein|nr:hypothetical protein [Chitinophagaceae bacterium]